jgi:hypothetical protein
MMSEQVQSIVEAVRNLDPDQRRELAAALANIGVSFSAIPAGRKQLVDSIRGKYRHVPTSSESFMSRKRDDTALESRP